MFNVILLVDDDPGVRFMMRLILEEEGVQLEEAASGEEALERLRDHTYDMLVLDYRMPPGMSGMDVAHKLRESGQDIPMVLYSAYLKPDVEEEARQLGIPTVDKGDHPRLLELIGSAGATA